MGPTVLMGRPVFMEPMRAMEVMAAKASTVDGEAMVAMAMVPRQVEAATVAMAGMAGSEAATVAMAAMAARVAEAAMAATA
jgi:selenocysteine lyase/cysteine desulfurase